MPCVLLLFYHNIACEETIMPDRRRRIGRLGDLLPENLWAWAQTIWFDIGEVAKLPSGTWILRAAAKELGLPEEAVDKVLRDQF
jgi:hypothetical protein